MGGLQRERPKTRHPKIPPFSCGSALHIFPASAAVSTHPYAPLGLCENYPKVITYTPATLINGLSQVTFSSQAESKARHGPLRVPESAEVRPDVLDKHRRSCDNHQRALGVRRWQGLPYAKTTTAIAGHFEEHSSTNAPL